MINDNFEFTDNLKYEENVTRPVAAIYSHPLLPMDQHNRLIAALPPKMTDKERSDFYYRKLPFEPSINGDRDVQLAEIDMLTTILLPLSTVRELEERVNSIIINSYHKRAKDFIVENQKAYVADERYNQALSMDNTDEGDGHTGLAFAGVGGCGKTTLTKRLFERYPKAVVHDTPRGQFVQILWLRSQPISNGDIVTFLDSIGKEIDRALMNTNNTYYNLIHSQRTIAAKTEKITELFRLFNVGILVIDEIQRFNVAKSRTDSFQTMMSIMNKSKVALMVIGTEQAYHKFFYEYYLARRFGSPLPASKYCTDYNYFTGLVKLVMDTNWFKTEQNITPDIIRTMYRETSGIIERIITIWMAVQKKYVKLPEDEKNTFVLTPEFIAGCADENEPFMADYARQTLDNDMILSESYEKCRQEAEGTQTVTLDPPKVSEPKTPPVRKTIGDVVDDKELFKTLADSPDITRTQKLYERVKANLTEAGDEYRQGVIMEKLVHAMKLKSSKNKTDDELVIKALKDIRKTPADKTDLKTMKIEEDDNSIRKIDFSKL